MKRSILLYLEDIIESIEKIEEYTRGLDEDDFKEDSKLQDAVMRRIGIIGEAVKNIPLKITSKYPDIPWKEIAGMKDFLIHSYFNANIERIWKVIEDDLPSLKESILNVKKETNE